MTVTRASAAAKGKGRAASPGPRDFADRTAAARASAERAAVSDRVAAARAPSAQYPAPYQERTASQSAFTRIPNGTQLETVVLAARAVEGVHPTITRRRVTDVTEVLHGAEAAAAIAVISAANAAEAEDPNAMLISRPSSPDPPTSLTNVEEVARFHRYNAVRELILATRDAVETRVAFESADEELAASLQAAEIAAANAAQNCASTSRLAHDATSNPATPMEITPGPAPIPRHATPASPSPMSGAGSGFVLGQPPRRLAALMAANERNASPAGPYDAQGRLPPAYCVENHTVGPSSTLMRGRTETTRASNPLTHSLVSAAVNGRGNASSAGPASSSRRNAPAGPSRPPAYALNEAGMSYFTMPVRPSPRNGFAEHEVIQTSTEIINGTPCITIFDSDADTEDADEARGKN